MEDFMLSNGVSIPKIGFGTWQIPEGAEAKNAVVYALQNGYRHIDTAKIYENEKSVGEGILASGISREEIFLTTKVWNSDRGYHETMAAFDKSLEHLQTDFIDLYLIHWPANAAQYDNWKMLNAETWRAMEDLYTSGRAKAIGVCNFLVHHLKALKETAKINPMVNQIEYHPGHLQSEVVDYCKDNAILVEAWSPIGSGKILNNELLKEIAGRYNASVAQLCIKFCLQTGTLPLPKSVTPANISSNLDTGHFHISDEDMQRIAQMGEAGFSGLNPDTVDF
ncbi:oxidoreductase [Elizabethkingia meningoseptica]|uniref:Oxidoreductase n=2 Tax=Elizabethkingia meningoseptica TaxID=238 RepID=A0A1V3U2K0_ELIME|nr:MULTISPECIES: aldo/keto reductase [Elizabethkingia]AQX13732.1 oxidoreductase [Elizabethkingia meningoseptica]MBG0515529.1 aldo/keto reductase [Elizabethkingia meningoseptica]MDE5434104.1 aldo/keto reductase [Elizabethkingia meningoseptica]MDE5450581.1 aldo/keto reductase [Elizabethkingia meningoseptica]MDE5470382.1 aldo/keto reductase [Elizabethkingia meningoseptica]